MKVIGDRKLFAIEYKITKKIELLGYGKVWFGGYSLGTNEDLLYFESYLFSGLEEIGKAKDFIFRDIENKSKLYYHLYKQYRNSDNPDRLKYLIRSFGPFCDDFLIFSFINNNNIYIIWKLWRNKTPFLDLNNQSGRINLFKINKVLYDDLLAEFRANLLEKKDF